MGTDSFIRLGPVVIMLTAFFVFIASSILFGFSHGVKEMPGFEAMNEMAKAEITTHTAPGGEPANKPDVFTMNKAMTVVMVCGVLGMLASVGACIGAKMENLCLLIIYFFVCVFFGAALIIVAGYGASFADVMEPVMASQIDSYCNETSYRTFKTELKCYNQTGSPTATLPSQATSRRLVNVTPAGNEIAPGTAATACGEECQVRKEFLERAGGCTLLNNLCTNWRFSTLSDDVATRAAPFAVNETGYCVLDVGGKRARAYAWTNQVTTVAPHQLEKNICQDLCNADITCTGFTYRSVAKECLLITPVKPPGAWKAAPSNVNVGVYPATGAPSTAVLENIVDADLDTTANCYIKVMPKILWDMESYIEKMSFYSMIGAIFFFVTAFASCCFMFTLGTKKQGKKGGLAMAHKLLCPCCRGEAQKKGQGRGQYGGIDDESN